MLRLLVGAVLLAGALLLVVGMASTAVERSRFSDCHRRGHSVLILPSKVWKCIPTRPEWGP